MSKGKRTVAQIEKAFVALNERNQVNEVSIREIKHWLDDNTTGGMALMRLANYLSKRPSFKMVRRERKIGTTETESFWTMPDATKKVEGVDEEGNKCVQEVPLMPGPYTGRAKRKGWVTDFGTCYYCKKVARLDVNEACSDCIHLAVPQMKFQ